MNSGWYLRRLQAIGPREMAWRLQDRLRQIYWGWRYYARGATPQCREIAGEKRFVGGIGRARASQAPQAARAGALAAADALLSGSWKVFRIWRHDVAADPDWHLDVHRCVRVSCDDYTFRIRTHGGNIGFDTKYVWELSRHHHTTLLAMAFWLTGEEAYARRAADNIASWRNANPFLHGIHWSSGIEIGLRLIAFTWTRRLLEDWPGAASRFESNPAFRCLVHAHQWLLARRMSTGSSANNHLIYEACGLFVSASAMPWFAQSVQWRETARRILEREFARQTFPSGYNRELASDYNGFVLEAMLIALAEIALGGAESSPAMAEIAGRALRKLADLADANGQPPRQGDGDDAHGLLLDAPDVDRWADLSSVCAAWFGAEFGREAQSLRGWLLGALVPPPADRARLPRESAARDAGLVILRQDAGTPNEIACAFDCGPLGYLSLAAHGHADALAIELRCGGQPILVDPGTYSYTAEPAWRDYFRSTAAHNTIELGNVSQSVSGGPFLWLRHAKSRLMESQGLTEDCETAIAIGEHDGYLRRPFAGRHRRTVMLHRPQRRIEIVDEVSASVPTPCRLLFHIHPSLACRLEANVAHLQWEAGSASLKLPAGLSWRAVRGCEEPILGWYSPSYDVKVPATTLLGEGVVMGTFVFTTSIDLPCAT
jgi:hypothetical protein